MAVVCLTRVGAFTCIYPRSVTHEALAMTAANAEITLFG
jgi:hypothetical protein